MKMKMMMMVYTQYCRALFAICCVCVYAKYFCVLQVKYCLRNPTKVLLQKKKASDWE